MPHGSRTVTGRNVMKTVTFLFGACALLALPMLIEVAAAGPCTTEIDSLTKLMASRDAGAGPTAGVAGTTSGQHPPTAAMGAADPSTSETRAGSRSSISRRSHARRWPATCKPAVASISSWLDA